MNIQPFGVADDSSEKEYAAPSARDIVNLMLREVDRQRRRVDFEKKYLVCEKENPSPWKIFSTHERQP